MLILCMLLKVINKVKVKVTSQGQGHMGKIIILLISTHLILCILLQNHWYGQGHTSRSKWKLYIFLILCSLCCCASGWFAFDWMHSCLYINCCLNRSTLHRQFLDKFCVLSKMLKYFLWNLVAIAWRVRACSDQAKANSNAKIFFMFAVYSLIVFIVLDLFCFLSSFHLMWMGS